MNTYELNAILTRLKSAKNMTDTLLSKTRAFANYIKSQMEELGIKSLLDGKYILRTVNASCTSDTSLYLLAAALDDYYTNHNCYVCLDVHCVSSEREERYMFNDYSATYNLPSRDDILTFIADADAILKDLANYSVDVDFGVIDSVITS